MRKMDLISYAISGSILRIETTKKRYKKATTEHQKKIIKKELNKLIKDYNSLIDIINKR